MVFIKYVKKSLKFILVIIGIVVLGFVLFFTWLDFTSPINEAGREYRGVVKSYRNEEIETRDDVVERLEVLDTHYNSPTFDKVQDAEKREVTKSDIETLFGEPHEVVGDVDMYNADRVYQYTYEDTTLNFHERFRTIDEYVIENYTETLYESNMLDKLFIDTMVNHQSQYDKENEEYPPITEDKAASLIMDNTRTRSIRQSGWHTWSLNRQDYFDDGQGEYSPTEYMSLQFMEGETTELYLMERRYHETFLEKDTPLEYEKKREAFYAIQDLNDQEESDEMLTVGDFSNALGDIARIIYLFRDGTLGVSWLMYDGEFVNEVIATAPVTDASSISNLDDLKALEVVEYNKQLLSVTDSVLNADAFIGRP